MFLFIQSNKDRNDSHDKHERLPNVFKIL